METRKEQIMVGETPLNLSYEQLENHLSVTINFKKLNSKLYEIHSFKYSNRLNRMVRKERINNDLRDVIARV